MLFLGDEWLIPALAATGVVAALLALAFAVSCVRHARARRHFRAAHRSVWTLLFALLALLAGSGALMLRGYRLLTQETVVATIGARELAPQQFAVTADFPDGKQATGTLRGDEWQLDARVIKWTPDAVTLGAEPLYRVERLSGRYRDAAQAQVTPPTLIALGDDSRFDLWRLKREFPRWLPWIDADYGSAAYLPLLDGARYTVTLSPLGGLIARPADAATAQKLKAAGW